ncbi:Enolase-phosphatase E1 [Mortierella hygrophila]|uniref:Enolase-phosphatase E1 n=1 Tax=Mortierella hygrophila TaxID=979708 RepID=A0A9P6FBY3_9FUNG|nr:Enolase-phosphatase E1 [Mortierella hygrophila]
MVLTRSRSNNQGNAAPALVPAPKKTAPATKRKASASAAPVPKVTKTDSTPDVATAKEVQPAPAEADPAPVETAPAPAAAVAVPADTPAPIPATAATTETLQPTKVPTPPPAIAAPEASTIPAPVEMPIVAAAEPVIASSEEPTLHHVIHPYDVVVTDIEGTTTPIVFVKENLFPYITSKLAEFLQRNWASEEMKSAVEALRVQAAKDVADGVADATPIAKESAEVTAEKVQQDVIASIGWQMKADRKIGALKAFQGYMWREGYTNGDLKGALYEDVIPAFDLWRAEGKKLYIYSSGSIDAQKLLFGFSEKGDLLHYFSGHYDTTIGLKVNAESYAKIAADIGLSPARILFLSDNIHEIVAAKKAGFQTVITDRPGNAPLTTEERDGNLVVKSFLEIPKSQ